MKLSHPTRLTGLCSVSFRSMSCDSVIALAKRSELSAIEWGTDIHLPANKPEHAHRVATQCRENGLATPTIGSYLRCEQDDETQLRATIQLAEILGAQRIRVWAGSQGSGKANERYRIGVVNNLLRYCDTAANAGLSIALEHHPDTLTDSTASSEALLTAVNHPALFSYWQPTPDLSITDALEQLDRLGHWIRDLHVFHWVADKQRRPLEDGRLFWSAVLKHLDNTQEHQSTGPSIAYLEFVRDDDPEQCTRDAHTLNSICGQQADNH